MQCLDGMFSGEDDNNSGIQEEELITLPKQYEILDEGSIEQPVVLQKGTREDAQSRFSAFSEWRTVADKHADSSTHPRSRMGKKNELSSSRRWTTWLKTEALKYKIMEEDSNRQPPVLQKDYLDDANKHAHGRKMLPKWSPFRPFQSGPVKNKKRNPKPRSTQVRMRMSSLQDVEGHDDGFSWRKYGQKEILGSQHPRSYYRCTHGTTQGCQAQKQLQRTDVDPELFDVMYIGNHTCIQGVNSQLQPAHEQSSISMGVKADGSLQGIEKKPPRIPKRIIQVRSLEDGFMWRKYGQKDILGTAFPRAYFRCAYKHERGCLATRQVQRSHSDSEVFDVVYNGEHTCGESVHSLPHHTSVSTGLMSPATSENMISFTAVSSSSSAAGIPFRFPATSASSQVTHEVVSKSTARVPYISPGTSESEVTDEGFSSSSAAGVRFRSPAASAGSQVTNEGPSRSTAGVRFMFPGASESQVTYEEVSGSTAGFWSWPDEVDSTTNSPKDNIDLNVDFVDDTSYYD